MASPAGITWTGLVANVVLSIAKVTAGVFFGSRTLLADGIHSGSDLVSDVAVLAGLRFSKMPPDPKHPYGHRRVQTLVGLFIGGLVIAAAIGVGISAVSGLRGGAERAYGWTPFVMALISVVVKEALCRLTLAVGHHAGDQSLLANAWHHRSDAFTSLAAAAGMFAVAVGGQKWAMLDHVTAIALAGLLVVMGLKLVAQSGGELIDRAPARDLMEGIAAVVAETPDVRGYHAFRMRRLGGKLEMDVHVQVDPHLSVAEGHDIATRVQERICQADPNVTSVVVHVEPAEKHAHHRQRRPS